MTTAANDNVLKFTTGKSYATRSICDHNCIFRFEVLKRTDKTITIRNHNKEVRRTVRVRDGVEYIDPFGRYSMAPVLGAGDTRL